MDRAPIRPTLAPWTLGQGRSRVGAAYRVATWRWPPGSAAVSLLQVLVAPIASRPVSVVVAVGSTLPLAWRWRRPVAAALADPTWR